MKSQNKSSLLAKSPTGINGLDEITGGGFPTGRPTLVCGNAGCGKTLLAMEFLDLLVNPQLGREHQILAIPTLVRKLPVHVRKIIGDLSDTEKVLVGLDLKQIK